MADFKPVADRVLIKPFPVSQQEGELKMLESMKRPQEGEVIAVGPDCKVARAGEKALYAKNAGTEVEFNGTTFVYMRESDLFATIGKQ
jgi:chaperonin GroES